MAGDLVLRMDLLSVKFAIPPESVQLVAVDFFAGESHVRSDAAQIVGVQAAWPASSVVFPPGATMVRLLLRAVDSAVVLGKYSVSVPELRESFQSAYYLPLVVRSETSWVVPPAAPVLHIRVAATRPGMPAKTPAEMAEAATAALSEVPHEGGHYSQLLDGAAPVRLRITVVGARGIDVRDGSVVPPQDHPLTCALAAMWGPSGVAQRTGPESGGHEDGKAVGVELRSPLWGDGVVVEVGNSGGAPLTASVYFGAAVVGVATLPPLQAIAAGRLAAAAGPGAAAALTLPLKCLGEGEQASANGVLDLAVAMADADTPLGFFARPPPPPPPQTPAPRPEPPPMREDEPEAPAAKLPEPVSDVSEDDGGADGDDYAKDTIRDVAKLRTPSPMGRRERRAEARLRRKFEREEIDAVVAREAAARNEWADAEQRARGLLEGQLSAATVPPPQPKGSKIPYVPPPPASAGFPAGRPLSTLSSSPAPTQAQSPAPTPVPAPPPPAPKVEPTPVPEPQPAPAPAVETPAEAQAVAQAPPAEASQAPEPAPAAVEQPAPQPAEELAAVDASEPVPASAPEPAVEDEPAAAAQEPVPPSEEPDPSAAGSNTEARRASADPPAANLADVASLPPPAQPPAPPADEIKKPVTEAPAALRRESASPPTAPPQRAPEGSLPSIRPGSAGRKPTSAAGVAAAAARAQLAQAERAPPSALDTLPSIHPPPRVADMSRAADGGGGSPSAGGNSSGVSPSRTAPYPLLPSTAGWFEELKAAVGSSAITTRRERADIVVDMNGCGIGDTGLIRGVRVLRRVANLTALHCDDNLLTDVGARALTSLMGSEPLLKLQAVSARRNFFSPAGVQLFASAVAVLPKAAELHTVHLNPILRPAAYDDKEYTGLPYIFSQLNSALAPRRRLAGLPEEEQEDPTPEISALGGETARTSARRLE